MLLIGAEHLTRWLDWDDRTMAVLFGDGAGAVVLEATDDDGDLLGFDVGADGSLVHLIKCEHGGTIEMDGKETFRRAVRIMVDSAQRALKDASARRSTTSPSSSRTRRTCGSSRRRASASGSPRTARSSVIDRYGNTSSASIPLALVDAVRRRAGSRPGDLALAHGLRRRHDLGERRAAVAGVTALVVLAAGRARRYGGVKPLAPIGPDGEAVIDLLAGDALRAGFERIVLVVNPDTGHR